MEKHIVYLTLLVVLCGIARLQMPCPYYSCRDDLLPFEPAVCMLRINYTLAYVSYKCADSKQVCPVSENNGVVKCRPFTQTGLKPGDHAKEDSWCYSRKRDSEGYCVGKVLNEACVNHIECDVGLYCDKASKKCVNASTEGQPCNNGEICQSYLTCYEGKCEKYGSLEVGQKVGLTGSAKNCKTRYMDYSTRTCEHGPVLVSPVFHNDTRATCTYTYKGVNITALPMCGFSSNGSLICPEKEGGLEEDWMDLLEYMLEKPSCHVLHDYGFCEKGKKLGCSIYLKGSYGFYQSDSVTNTLLRDVPSCIKNWMYTSYWYPQCGTSFGASLVAGPLAILLLAVILIL